jgi:hypothetical protein
MMKTRFGRGDAAVASEDGAVKTTRRSEKMRRNIGTNKYEELSLII